MSAQYGRCLSFHGVSAWNVPLQVSRLTSRIRDCLDLNWTAFSKPSKRLLAQVWSVGSVNPGHQILQLDYLRYSAFLAVGADTVGLGVATLRSWCVS